MKNRIVSKEEWKKERIALQKKEKEFTQLRDKLTAERLSLPWVKVEEDYIFETDSGKKSLKELFGKYNQLIVYHFMYGPDYGDEGCKSCSLLGDNFERAIVHLNQRDANLICVSRAPLEKLDAFKKRMNWTFEWVSSLGNRFNYDYNVTSKAGEKCEYNFKEFTAKSEGEMPGLSVFYKDEDGNIYNTYSCYARELESFLTVYRFLDVVPKGRDEGELSYGMEWVKHHDKY